MGTDSLFDLIFFAVLFSVFAWFGWSMIRHRGFKGAMFGARILESVGEVSADKRMLMTQKLKVHVLEGKGPGDRSVGIEITTSGPGSWSTSPIRISADQARRLSGLLEEAVARGISAPL